MNKKNKRRTKLVASVLTLAMAMGNTAAFAADTTTPAGSTTGTSAGTTTNSTSTNNNTSTNTTNSTINSTSLSNTSVRTSFTDVVPNTWYTKHVTKLATLGIIEGYANGSFLPDNQVSQQDAIIMAIRMMGLAGEVKNASYALPVTVDDYAKPYVALAIDKGLISAAEETEGTSGSSKTAWGSKPATREWVAKIVVRAAGKEVEAKQVSSVPSSFQDAKEFSSWALGYINEAYLLKIVNGIDDYNFGPKNAVTRAQMATFLSRADQYLTKRSERVITGYAAEITDKKITVLDAKGQSYDYTISPEAAVYSAKSENKIAASAIKQTYEVYVVAVSGTAYYIEITNDQERMESAEGILSELYVDQMMVSIMQNGKKNLQQLAANVTVTDKDGRGMSLGSIPIGSKVELKRSLLVANSKISQIIVKEVPINKKAEGSIVNPKDQDGRMVFLEQSSGNQETYAVSNRVTVVNVDGSVGELGKLRAGDVVGYEIVNNEIVSIKVHKAADFGTNVQGTLTSVNQDKTIITINKTGNTLGAYYIADNTIVSVEGLSNAGIYDLEVGDQLSLDILNDKVVKITVTNRSVNDLTFAEIVNYDPDLKLLTVAQENGSYSVYKLTDSTVYKSFDLDTPYDTFKKYLEKGTHLDIRASKDKLISVSLSQNIDGTVTQVNTSADPDEITVRTAGGQNLRFNVTYGASIDVIGKGKSATLSDVKVGDTVRLALNRDQDMVNSIVSKKSGIYKVLVINTADRQISVKDETGTLSTVTVDNNNKIVKATQTGGTFEDIVLDEYVKMSFYGSTLEKVNLMNTIRGKVTGVDSASSTVTVQDFSGAVQVIPVGKNFTIKLNGTTSAALTSVKTGDRVEVIKDGGDQVLISVAQATKRVVASYDYVLNQLQLKSTANNDKTTYNFHAKAYLHSGTNTIAPNAFAENDEVTVYVLDDKIIEIEK
ncbi:S-layer homology domain-containing protein [Paenibacillus hamazuiensis]|uniref:S-layer homology domain-containing protein n=1 Tax=Paenibacillus hamazuiensis TaxID=2936508 RepID=UPI00200EB85E|nr:S-layer homology domain-containing protein [Paenibacillus hamazuiensis]